MTLLGRLWCALCRRPYLPAACDRHAPLTGRMTRAIHWGGLVRATADRLAAGEAPAAPCCRIGSALIADAGELLAEAWACRTAIALMEEADGRR